LLLLLLAARFDLGDADLDADREDADGRSPAASKSLLGEAAEDDDVVLRSLGEDERLQRPAPPLPPRAPPRFRSEPGPLPLLLEGPLLLLL